MSESLKYKILKLLYLKKIALSTIKSKKTQKNYFQYLTNI